MKIVVSLGLALLALGAALLALLGRRRFDYVSVYAPEQIKIRAVYPTKTGAVIIQFVPPLEALFWCPGSRVTSRGSALLLEFVRAGSGARPPVDARATRHQAPDPDDCYWVVALAGALEREVTLGERCLWPKSPGGPPSA